MGLVFGRTGISVENGLSPKYDVIFASEGYEVRNYLKYVVAEVARKADASATGKDRDDSFILLAKYIGVFGSPANKIRAGADGESQTISMTAPVVMEPAEAKPISMTAPVVMEPPPTSSDGPQQLSMTAPVVTEGSGGLAEGERTAMGTMQFIMPSEYTTIADLPMPTDPRVTLKEVPEHSVIARKFSGNMPPARQEAELAALEVAVRKDGIFSDWVGPDKKWLAAGYNPPWTVPFLKRNEVWVPLPLSREAIEKLVTSSKSSMS